MSNYAETTPPKGLAAAVECFWSVTDINHSQTPKPILPDGCIDLVFRVFESGTMQGWVVGAMTQAMFPITSGAQAFFGLRFKPGGAPGLLGSGLHELTDGTCLLEEKVPAIVAEIQKRLDKRNPDAWCLGDVIAGIARYGHGKLWAPDRRLVFACAQIDRAHGQLSLANLASEMGMTRQHLGRLFREQIGLPPKTYARIRRFQKIIAHAEELVPKWGWSGVAHQFGFVDQSHLIADFQDLSRSTPAQFFPFNRNTEVGTRNMAARVDGSRD